MPSFYPRQMPRQLPLTPPEFVPSYPSNSCGPMHYPGSSFGGQPAVRQQDEGYDFADRYGQLSIAMPPMYPQAGTYLSNASQSLPAPNGYYEPVGAPILPPMRLQNGAPLSGSAVHQQRVQEQSQRAAAAPKEEKPVGGVSAKLDYDMDVMTDFVCEMAHGIIQPSRPLPPSFRKWVHAVLVATRLPSATIMLSMFYLSSRATELSAQGRASELHLYRSLTIGLVLGSKFLDDNTFINRSWSEVSGIPVADLNTLEIDWLVAIEWKLHRDPTEQQGWSSWQEHWKDYQTHASRSNKLNKLNPIDTSVQQQRSFNQNKPLPPLPSQQQSYAQPPAYDYVMSQPYSAEPFTNSRYDPWLAPRQSVSIHNSPGSAITTGPTTPEGYYGGPNTWAPPEGYSRRTMFGFSSMSQAPPQSQQQPHSYPTPAYTPQYSASVWNSHPMNCQCMYCAQRHPPYFMASGFGPQAVAG